MVVLKMVKRRNPALVIIFMIITLGIYGIYWYVKTKEEIKSQGAQIPTAWLLIIPIVCLYWLFRYAEGFSNYVRKDNNPVLWFLFMMFIPIIPVVLIQMDLNKLATE